MVLPLTMYLIVDIFLYIGQICKMFSYYSIKKLILFKLNLSSFELDSNILTIILKIMQIIVPNVLVLVSYFRIFSSLIVLLSM